MNTDTDTLAVVKLLARGRAIPFVAEAVGIPGDLVAEIGGAHGWPDRARLKAAAQHLERASLDPISLAATPTRAFRPEPAPAAAPGGTTTKTCSKCRTIKPFSAFHADRRRKDGLCLQCKDCMREAPSQKHRPYTPSRAVRTRARQRALRRLADLHPQDFARLTAEEVEKARAELEPLQAAATASGKGTSHTRRHDPVHRRKPIAEVAALLKGGPRLAGQSAADRLRDDVGRCPLCIDNHDRGHTCPACGSTPDLPGEAVSA